MFPTNIYIEVLYIGNLKTFGDFGPTGPPICEENTFRRTQNMFMQRVVLGTTMRRARMGSNHGNPSLSPPFFGVEKTHVGWEHHMSGVRWVRGILSSLIKWIQHWWGRDRDTKGRQLWEKGVGDDNRICIQKIYIYIYTHTHIVGVS